MGFEEDVEVSIVSIEVVLDWHGRNDSAEGGGVEDEQERWRREMWRQVSKCAYSEGARGEVG